MNKKNIIIIYSVIVVVLLLSIINQVLKQTNIIGKETKILQKMDETEQVSSLQTQINTLNTEHTEYMNYIQTCKNQIAAALTNEGVTTSNQATLETMAENVSKILQVRTSDATATTEDIMDGKTAYVNGELITGTANKNDFNGTATVLYTLWDGSDNSRTVSIKNGLSYKVIFASFYYDTVGNYTFGVSGGTKISEWGSNNYYNYRHNNAVIIPTSDNVTITGYGGSMYVVGVK